MNVSTFLRWLIQPPPPAICAPCSRGIHLHDIHSDLCINHKAGCVCGGRS